MSKVEPLYLGVAYGYLVTAKNANGDVGLNALSLAKVEPAALDLVVRATTACNAYPALVADRRRLIEALRELIWAWDCNSVQGAFQFCAIHGMGETEETPRIVAVVNQARALLASLQEKA